MMKKLSAFRIGDIKLILLIFAAFTFTIFRFFAVSRKAIQPLTETFGGILKNTSLYQKLLTSVSFSEEVYFLPRVNSER